MGHRALVAYERPDGLYNLHYSHWGGRGLKLKHDLTKDTPFGANESQQWTQQLFGRLIVGTDKELDEPDEANRPNTEVEIEPRAVGVTLDEILTTLLDYHTHEAFYVVSPTFDVTAYRTFWLGFSSVARTVSHSPSIGHGVCMTVRWYDEKPVGDGYVRGWFAGTKQLLGEFVDRGMFTESQAITHLLDRLLEQVDDRHDGYVRRADRESYPRS